jgi:hypothetical protein
MYSTLLLCLLAGFVVVPFASGSLAEIQEIAPPILMSGVNDGNRSGTPLSEQPTQRAAAQRLFNTASLPPIESIGAGSDIRPFLVPGVPQDLTRAALRRVWLTDPVIRDFIGLSENSWDFNAPDAVPGFSSLITDDAGRHLARLPEELLDAPGKGALGPNESGR